MAMSLRHFGVLSKNLDSVRRAGLSLGLLQTCPFQTSPSRVFCSRAVRWYNLSPIVNHQLPTRAQRRQSHQPDALKRYKSFQQLPVLQHSRLIRRFATQAASRLTIKDENFYEYVKSLCTEYEDGCKEMTSGNAPGKVVKRVQELSPVIELFHNLEGKCKDAEELLKLQSDPEMGSMAAEDYRICLIEIEELEKSLLNCLVQEELVDNCDIILEVSQGVGGAEAMLFTAEIFQMYENFAAYKGWTFDVINLDKNEIGGLRSASAAVGGSEVYRMLKFEGGVHRVQRVPKTEKTGRVHTSTMSVAVYPQPAEVDIELNPKDLRVDTFRASGKGGQHVNKTESAVRIVHLPTGLKAECQEGRSQIHNRTNAMKMLKSRLYENQLEAQRNEVSTQRKLQVGSKTRSEKLRTYNFSQDRITDHRLGQNFYNIEQFMQGGPELEELILLLLGEAKLEVLMENVDRFVSERKKAAKKTK